MKAHEFAATVRKHVDALTTYSPDAVQGAIIMLSRGAPNAAKVMMYRLNDAARDAGCHDFKTWLRRADVTRRDVSEVLANFVTQTQ